MRRTGVLAGDIGPALARDPGLQGFLLEVPVIFHAEPEQRVLTPAGEAAIPDQIALRQGIVLRAPFDLSVERAGAAGERGERDDEGRRQPGDAAYAGGPGGHKRGGEDKHHADRAGGTAAAQKQADHERKHGSA